MNKQISCWTIPLSDLSSAHRSLVGAKALNLGLMWQAGFPIPPGFVLTTSAFDSYLKKQPEWKEFLQTTPNLSIEQIARLSQRLLAIFSARPSFVEIEEALTAAIARFPYIHSWAVRSSSTAEDMPSASFAGQYESFLNVSTDEIPSRVRACWQSLFTPHAWLYRMHHRIQPHYVAMAVILQQMVPADAAGVMFTEDPTTTNNRQLIIEYASGLGDRVVAGKVETKKIMVSKRTNETGQRSYRTVPDATGLPNEKSGELCVGRDVLNDETIQKLAKLGVLVEEKYTNPSDIEWAVQKGEIFLLQARPITGKICGRNWADRQVWTNANAGEALPDVVTPMSYSILWMFIQKLFDDLIGFLGINMDARQVLDVIHGRAYFNINACMALIKFLPLISLEDLNRIFGGIQEHLSRMTEFELSPEDLPQIKFDLKKALLGLPPMIGIWLYFTFRANDGMTELPCFQKERHSNAMPHLSDLELLQLIKRSLSDGEFVNHPMLKLMGISISYVLLLYLFLERLFGKEGTLMAGRLVAGLGKSNPAQAGRELWLLAEWLNHHKEARKIFCTENTFEKLKQQMSAFKQGQEFLNRWQRFMDQYGHHSRGEVEIYSARWQEEPELVLRMLRNYLEAIEQQIPNPAASVTGLTEKRLECERECLARMKNPLKRIVFRWILRRAQIGITLKENVKSGLVRHLADIRLCLLELGRRLVQQGRCSQVDDVFFLKLEELDDKFIFHDCNRLGETVSRRKAEYAQNQKLHLPHIICGDDEIKRQLLREIPVVNNALRGLPASPGITTGHARVIMHPSPEDRVLAGEILVAPYSDPGWSLYFLTAAGIAIDLGGMLSHGSILAREYGIPAVTNLMLATKTIQTGDLIRVDGDNGCVTILKKIGR